MKLFLVQHGEALAKEIDPKRPLSSQGIEDVNRVANFLKKANIQAENIIHSGKLRAKQTAEILAQSIGSNQSLSINERIKPNDDPMGLLAEINIWEQDTLMVGHLPFMEKLVSCLISGKDEPVFTAYQPGSIVCLEKKEQQKWQICFMIRPGLIVH